MSIQRFLAAPTIVMLLMLALAPCAVAQQPVVSHSPVTVSVFNRTRVDASQWFAAPPASETYGYVEQLLRVGVSQKIGRWNWKLELSQPSVLGLPDDAIGAGPGQGQLGLGATYWAVNDKNQNAADAFFKQGFLCYHFARPDTSVRLGRFEFIDGKETKPKNATIAWLQNARIGARLIGNFGFSTAQRSFDGADAHYGGRNWDLTAMAGRADQGVFDLNGNPELDVDIQYLALTRSEMNQHVLWRVFGLGFHDGRTGLTKTDNRPLAVRSLDHRNVRIGTYGGDVLAAFPAGPGNFDFLAWGVVQKGAWGTQDDFADAEAVEGGYHLTKVAGKPWLRGGWFRGSGDDNPADGEHNTFFQVLPTPRVYARFPFYNLMNSTDEFVQLMVRPAKKLSLRSDVHWLQLTSGQDLWYQGGGAFNNKVFGYVGRPSNGATSFSSLYDISASWKATRQIAVNLYYAHAFGKTVIGDIYPTDRDANYGYAEVVYHWNAAKQGSVK